VAVRPFSTIFDRLILGLYAYMPALRTEDWTSLKRYDGEKELDCNYISVERGRIVWERYKTSGSYGRRELNIPEELLKIVREYYGESRGEYFLMRGSKRMTSEELQRHLRRRLGISSNELRKIYISEVVPYLSKKERMVLGGMMGHSIEMQEFVYRREKGERNEGVLVRLRKQMEAAEETKGGFWELRKLNGKDVGACNGGS